MPALQELPPDFVHAAEKEIGLGPPLGFRQVGFDQPVLDFEGVAPFFKPDLEIAFADQGHQVVRLNAENILKGLERLFISAGTLQVFCQFEQDFYVAFFDAVGLFGEGGQPR